MTALWLAYLGLAVGLMTFGAILGWVGYRRSSKPLPTALRGVLVLAGLVALAGAIAAAILEAQAVGP